jgi:hypothetical protein
MMIEPSNWGILRQTNMETRFIPFSSMGSYLVLKMKLCAPTLSQVLKKASWVHHGLVHHFELVQDLGQPI